MKLEITKEELDAARSQYRTKLNDWCGGLIKCLELNEVMKRKISTYVDKNPRPQFTLDL